MKGDREERQRHWARGKEEREAQMWEPVPLEYGVLYIANRVIPTTLKLHLVNPGHCFNALWWTFNSQKQ